MQLNKAVSYRVSQLMADNGLTQYKIFSRTGLAKSTVSNLINYRYKAVNLTTLHVLCQGLGITLNEFFDSPLFANENLDP